MQKTRNRRRRYLVNKKLQMQFTLLLIAQITIPTVIFGGFIYIINRMYLTSLQRLIGSSVISDLYIQSILNFSVFAIGSFLLIAILLVMFLGIIFSHHVAGPLYKLGESMERLARGEKVEPIHFRRTDIVDGLDKKFNTIAEKLNQLLR